MVMSGYTVACSQAPRSWQRGNSLTPMSPISCSVSANYRGMVLECRSIGHNRHEMKVTVVFDGAPLNAKSETESERARARAEALQKAIEFEASGNKFLAQTLFAKAVDVTPQMAFEVSEAIKPLGVEVIVAPYEADAQLGYLSTAGLIDAVISEDSDLLVYGCRRVLYKVDFKTERGREIRLDRVSECGPFSRLSDETFLLAAVLAGCDYAPSLASIGITTALKLAAKAESILKSGKNAGIDSDWFVERLLMLIRLSGVDLISEDFGATVQRAIRTFRHQTVFCPLTRRLVPLSPLPGEGLSDCSFLGDIYSQETACQVAGCAVDPETKVKFVLPSKSYETKVPHIKAPPKKKLKPFSIPSETSHKTLIDMWCHQVPFSTASAAEFANPVVDLVSDENSPQSACEPCSPVSQEVDLKKLDVFAAGASKAASAGSKLNVSTNRASVDSLDSFRFGN